MNDATPENTRPFAALQRGEVVLPHGCRHRVQERRTDIEGRHPVRYYDASNAQIPRTEMTLSQREKSVSWIRLIVPFDFNRHAASSSQAAALH
jgi:hypothetical protein